MNIVHYVAVRIELYDMYNDYELNACAPLARQIGDKSRDGIKLFTGEWYVFMNEHRMVVLF